VEIHVQVEIYMVVSTLFGISYGKATRGGDSCTG
jgi:hypothetical protein